MVSKAPADGVAPVREHMPSRHWPERGIYMKPVLEGLSLVGGLKGLSHDAVIKWKHFPRYWPFVWGVHRSSVNPPHKGQWRGALMFSLTCAWTDGWVNNRDACNLRRHRVHYDVAEMCDFIEMNLSYSTCPAMIIRYLRIRYFHFSCVRNTCVCVCA